MEAAKGELFPTFENLEKSCSMLLVWPTHVPFTTRNSCCGISFPGAAKKKKKRGRVSGHGRILQLKFEKQALQLQHVKSLAVITHIQKARKNLNKMKVQ